MTFRPPLKSEHHGPAIVHLQSCVEELDTRLTQSEALISASKRWLERIAWAAVMAALFGANLSKEQLADLAVKLLAVLFGG
jgi:hypothetical protein